MKTISEKIKTTDYLNEYDRIIRVMEVTRNDKVDIIVDGDPFLTGIRPGDVQEGIEKAEKQYRLKVALGDLDKYGRVVYSGKQGDYDHFCPHCGQNARDMDCLGESGFYDRTCYLICKCGSHLLEFG